MTGRVTDKGIVDTGIRHKVGLELVQIDVESTVEAQAGGNGADDLSDEAVQVLIVRSRDVQATTADVVHGFVVDEERAVRVLDGAVSRENSIVRLHDRGRDTRRRVDGEFKLALLAVVGGETLEKKSAQSQSLCHRQTSGR